MRTIPPAVLAQFKNPTANIARLVKLTTQSGTVYGFTDTDLPITVNGVEYKPAPGLSAARLTSTASTEVSSQTFQAGWVDVPEEDLRGGRLDNADIVCSWVAWEHPDEDDFITFSGKLGEITWDESGFNVDIVDFMKALERNIGHTYKANCRHELYGRPGPGTLGACMVDPAGYTFEGSIASVVTPKWVFTIAGAAAGKADGYYSNGFIKFKSGLNTGLSVVVKSHVGNQITLFLPTAFVLPEGTTFTIQAGCDKTLGTCKAKFNNVVNHGGFPHINPNVQYR